MTTAGSHGAEQPMTIGGRRHAIGRLVGDESGQAAVEYALITAALLLGLFAAATGLKELLGGVYQGQQRALSDWRAP